MAIGRLSVKSGSKGKALAHAKYILREDKYAKQIEKKGEKLEAVGHGNMPVWSKDNPNFFWQMADEMERKNGSVYREHIITLPRELDEAQRHELIKDWIKNEIGDKHPYSYAIHNPLSMDGGEQPHCHLMFCERTLDGIERQPDQFFKRYNSKNPEKGGAKKANTGLDHATRKQQIKDLRSRWEQTCNKHLWQANKSVQISMKSLKNRGIDRQPTNISMAEMNKPEVKQAYKDHLQARQAFTQSFQAVTQGMNVQAELAKAPTQPLAPQPKNYVDEFWEKERAEREAFKQKLDIVEKPAQKPLEKQKENLARVVPPTSPNAPTATQKTPKRTIESDIEHKRQLLAQYREKVGEIAEKIHAQRIAEIEKQRLELVKQSKPLYAKLQDIIKNEPMFGKAKWEQDKQTALTAYNAIKDEHDDLKQQIADQTKQGASADDWKKAYGVSVQMNPIVHDKMFVIQEEISQYEQQQAEILRQQQTLERQRQEEQAQNKGKGR